MNTAAHVVSLAPPRSAGSETVEIRQESHREILLLSMNRPPERGPLSPRDPETGNTRTRRSTLLPLTGSWSQCAVLKSWRLPLNPAGTNAKLSLPARHEWGESRREGSSENSKPPSPEPERLLSPALSSSRNGGEGVRRSTFSGSGAQNANFRGPWILSPARSGGRERERSGIHVPHARCANRGDCP